MSPISSFLGWITLHATMATCLLGPGAGAAAMGNFPRLASQTGEIVLNEIMYAPAQGEPEWLELRNKGSEAVNLRGWMISDANVTLRHSVTGDDLTLSPGEYLLLTRDSLKLTLFRPHIRCRVRSITGFPSLNNDGDALFLYDSKTTVVDSVRYLPEWGGSSGGKSLEKTDPLAPGQDPTCWGTCVDPTGATPGEENSIGIRDHDLRAEKGGGTPSGDRSCDLWVTIRNVGRAPASGALLFLYEIREESEPSSLPDALARIEFPEPIAPADSTTIRWPWLRPSPGMHRLLAIVSLPLDSRAANDSVRFFVAAAASKGDLVVNEIMFAPLPGEAEYVELWNTTTTPLNLSAWMLHDRAANGENPHTVSFPPRAGNLMPGSAAVIASDSTIFHFFPDLIGNNGRYVLIPPAWGLRLNNDGDDLVLKDPSGRTIDSVAYSPSWHNPAVLDRRGRSLERMLETGHSNDPLNWSTCILPQGGTPCRRNSIFPQEHASPATIHASPNPFSPDEEPSGAFLPHYPYRQKATAGTVFASSCEPRDVGRSHPETAA